ncbi:PAAR domain-containing protein [Burkholderia ubonensis]|uniref:PAAR domain-containing protein n=1 Tax=Burkholderia ubonensis TaxID=101571 RepID=UPI0009B33D95|nr:PAAR domain-containing protein [Burkholderia ubonensis]
MKRSYIIVGDTTTAGGVVIQGEPVYTTNGKPLAHHEGKVYCHACKSEGYIRNVGPSRPMMLMGKQVALENDLCICKCNPPPRLIASQNSAFMEFDSKELETMGYTPQGRYIGDASYDQHFQLKDKHTGRPLQDMPYRIVTDDGEEIEGRTDANGNTEKIYAKRAVIATIDIFEEHVPLNPNWDRYL